MEPGSELLVENGDNAGQAIISIAMSLKRIADTLDGTVGGGIVGQFFEWQDRRTRE